MNTRLTASVAMCTYNGGQYLQKQLDSLCRQTVLPDELIICDDCSTDTTPVILKHFAQTAPFTVHIHYNEHNLGYVRNFGKAGQLCNHDVVFFCDQDDIWLPEKIEQVTTIFSENPQCDLVLLSAQRIDKDDNPLPFPRRIQKKMDRNPPKANIEPYYVKNALHRWVASWQGCNMAYRNTKREVIYPIDSLIGHDQWILLLLGVLSNTLILHSPTMLYRVHNSNVSRITTQRTNLLARALYSLGRHQNPQRYRDKAQLFESLLKRVSEYPSQVQHEDLLPVFRRFEEHMTARAEAIESIGCRAQRILTEYIKGNYQYCSRGLPDALSDLIAWPGKRE